MISQLSTQSSLGKNTLSFAGPVVNPATSFRRLSLENDGHLRVYRGKNNLTMVGRASDICQMLDWYALNKEAEIFISDTV